MNSFEKLLISNSQLAIKLERIESKLDTILQQMESELKEIYVCPFCGKEIADIKTYTSTIEKRGGIKRKAYYAKCPQCSESLKLRRILDEKHR